MASGKGRDCRIVQFSCERGGTGEGMEEGRGRRSFPVKRVMFWIEESRSVLGGPGQRWRRRSLQASAKDGVVVWGRRRWELVSTGSGCICRGAIDVGVVWGGVGRRG